MALHLSRILEECQPRIAIMTGICAGDSQYVQLGDGKFTRDEHNRHVHKYDTIKKVNDFSREIAHFFIRVINNAWR